MTNTIATLALARRASKTDLVLEMLERTEGATLDQLVEATGWLPHSTRAALTGLRKKGHEIISAKDDQNVRVYRAVGSSVAVETAA